MEEQFLQKIFYYIEENKMIKAGDIVLVGVSGGADSMCLLAALLAYQKQMDFALRVIHVEHGIRGVESEVDAAYVEWFCREQGVPCEIAHVDAVEYARERRLSVEEAARMLRYEMFERCAVEVERGCKQFGEMSCECEQAGEVLSENGQTEELPDESRELVWKAPDGHVRIAVAHHREDQAETVLWQMIRGSDVRGLGGMQPKRERMIRPLLCASRSEIETYLNAEGIHWREDSTNVSMDYTRNCMRQEVMPVLNRLNTQATRHIFETAERLRETEDFLRKQTECLYEQYVHRAPNGELFLEDALIGAHSVLARRVMYEALCRSLGSARDIGAEHVRLLGSLFSRQVGRVLHLPYGGRAKRVYGGVRLSAKASAENDTEDAHGVVFAGESAEALRMAALSPEQVQMEVLTQFDLAEISKKKYTKWFNYDRINHNVQIRRRESGDYLMIDGAGHRQKLSRYLINEKIPREERDRLLLVADGSHIMWVIGHRISDYYKVDESTTKVLKVQLSGGKEDE